MRDYTRFMQWAVVSVLDRATQDDHKSKIRIAGLFDRPAVAEDSFIPYLPSSGTKWYLLHVDELEQFEEFYNFIQDLNEKYGDYAIYHIKDGGYSCDTESKFRQILGLWTDTKLA